MTHHHPTRSLWLLVSVTVALLLSLAQIAIPCQGGLAQEAATPAAATEQSASGASLLAQESQTRVFRQGLEGYTGATDTYLQHDSYEVRGAEQMVHVKETSYGTKRAVMRFDLTAIPHYMEIVEARLELFVGYRYPESSASASLFHVLRPWDEATATWYTTGVGNWGTLGCGGEGTDYETPAFATTSLPTTNGYHSIPVTAAVQRWVQNPAANHGFLLRGGSSVDARCWSKNDPRENERPKLTVTYRLPANITPPPTYTLTPTHTPTPAPSATPTPANVIQSIAVHQVFPPDDKYRQERDCIQAGPYPGNPASTNVLLVWEGIPTSAKLSFTYANNNDRAHSVMVNGQVIGRLPGANYASTCTGGSYAEIGFDPALVRSGLNEISITADVAGELNTWSLQSPVIYLGGFVQGTDTRVVDLTSSYDGTSQRAMIQKPVDYRPGLPTPLVIALHGWGGRDYDALQWFAQATSDRRWLLACSDTRATFAHTPTKAIQRDIIDLINWMVASPDYDVDTSRIYIVGSSMGGMMASVIAAKYPDRFAALAEFKGPTDLADWYYESPSRQANIAKDCDNHSPGVDPFAYQRKSVSSIPMNLGNMPAIIVHGSEDTVVPYHHATDLVAGLDTYADLYYGRRLATLYTYAGGHYDDHPDWAASDVLTFFGQHVVAAAPMTITVRTDEPKSYYWLDIAYAVATAEHWTQVNAWRNIENQSVTLDVFDERDKAVNVTLDLARLGLPTGVSYTVEDSNLSTGSYEQLSLQPTGNLLTVSIPRYHHRLVVYPHGAPQPQTVTLSQGQNGYAGVADTFIEAFVPGATHANESLRLTNSGNRTALVRFHLDGAAPIPQGAAVKSAQLRLYAQAKWDPAHTIETALYPLLKDWDVHAATWQKRTASESWLAPGAGAAGEDYEATRYGPVTMEAVPQWYAYNVTELVRRWVSDPSSNHGVIARAEGGSGTFTLNSSESPSNRPELVVVWSEATLTRTPTVTPTHTSTLTPTPTATVTRWVTATPTARAGGLALPLVMHHARR